MNLPDPPSFRLDGKRALVTGAGRGIGLAAAAALAFAGAEVTLAARTGMEVEAAADAIRARGGRAEAMVADVTDIPGFARLVAERGPFDVLVNNAGGSRHAHVLDVTEDDYDAVTDLNVRAAFFAMQAVAAGCAMPAAPARSSTSRPRWATSAAPAAPSTARRSSRWRASRRRPPSNSPRSASA